MKFSFLIIKNIYLIKIIKKQILNWLIINKINLKFKIKKFEATINLWLQIMNKVPKYLIMKQKKNHNLRMIFLNHKIRGIKIQNQIFILYKIKVRVFKKSITHLNFKILFKILYLINLLKIKYFHPHSPMHRIIIFLMSLLSKPIKIILHFHLIKVEKSIKIIKR